MPATQRIPTAEEALRSIIAAIDLADVRMKLADAQEGPGCSQDELDIMEAEYRKFLALQLSHPEAIVVPCQLVDRIWHQHILDTAAYRGDCDAVFGRFLDHYPYFGMRDAEEARELDDAYAETLELYRRYFGEPPAGTWVNDADPARCRKPTCRR